MVATESGDTHPLAPHICLAQRQGAFRQEGHSNLSVGALRLPNSSRFMGGWEGAVLLPLGPQAPLPHKQARPSAQSWAGPVPVCR